MCEVHRKRRVAITVDVEAHTIRAARDHVNRLIWGRQNGREAGIQTMMDIADRHGVPMTFFLDYPEAELYGEDLLDVGREIHRRGHDLQPHCHVEYLVKRLFGLDDMWAVRLPTATPEQSRAIVDSLVERHAAITGSSPLAYRSGAYLIGPHYLDALKQSGVRLDASYNLCCPENPFSLGLRGPFVWQNGLWEIPVPLIPYFQKANHLVAWNFNFKGFLRSSVAENVVLHKKFLDTWFKRHGDDAIATLIMHSWSFWQMDAKGHMSIPLEGNEELFDALLRMLKDNFTIVNLGEVAKNEAPDVCLERVSPLEATGHCPVCYEPVSHFQDYNAPERQCPFCKSVERQRTLVDLVYAGAFGPQIFNGKDILHIAPCWSEQLLLRRMHECRVTTLNIQPGCDMQADIQAMPELADNSFDIVLASEVFRHVRNLDAALKEIARVLRPGGLLLCSDCLENADYGREITDEAEQISWYGKEKLEAYGIGDFRRFGRKDWEEAFKPYFYIRIFKADDKATGDPAWWMICVPRKGTKHAFSAAILCSNAGRILYNAQADPVSDFFPSFSDWPRFREAIAEYALQKENLEQIKNAIYALHFTTVECIDSYESAIPNFLASYPSSVIPYPAQAWRHLLPSLRDDPARGDSPHLRHIMAGIECWLDVYGSFAHSPALTPHTRFKVWTDSAVAIRVNVMAYALLRAATLTSCDDARYERLFRAMLDHILLLCADHFFSGTDNHGLLQILGLLVFTKALPCFSWGAHVQALATKRLRKLLERMVTSEGFVREHSSEYQAAILPILANMERFLTEESDRQFLRTQLKSLRAALAHFIRPDGSLAPLGDTPPFISPSTLNEITRARARVARQKDLALFPKSGYAFVRARLGDNAANNVSWLALQGAFHSRIHKHCDDLAFLWSEGKQNILVDSGQQYGYDGLLFVGPLYDKGFYFSAPNRVYSESVHAHNAVEIHGESYSRKIPPPGALPLSGGQLSEKYWLLEGEWQRPEGFRQQRRLVFSPARWLLVMDEVQPLSVASPEHTSFSQWFHLDASLNLLSCERGQACAMLPDKRKLYCQNLNYGELSHHKGEFAPRMQAWQATESTQWLEPAWTIGVHQRGKAAQFATLFSLCGPCISFRVIKHVCHIQFENESGDDIILQL